MRTFITLERRVSEQRPGRCCSSTTAPTKPPRGQKIHQKASPYVLIQLLLVIFTGTSGQAIEENTVKRRSFPRPADLVAHPIPLAGVNLLALKMNRAELAP